MPLSLEIVSDAGSNNLAGDSLATLASKENKREVRILLPNSLQEFEPIHAGHVVVRNNAIRRAMANESSSLVGIGRRLDSEVVVFVLENRPRQLHKRELVADVRDGGQVSHGVCYARDQSQDVV